MELRPGLQVAVQDDHRLVREGFARLLASEPEVRTASCVAALSELAGAVDLTQLDVLLFDDPDGPDEVWPCAPPLHCVRYVRS